MTNCKGKRIAECIPCGIRIGRRRQACPRCGGHKTFRYEQQSEMAQSTPLHALSQPKNVFLTPSSDYSISQPVHTVQQMNISQYTFQDYGGQMVQPVSRGQLTHIAHSVSLPYRSPLEQPVIAGYDISPGRIYHDPVPPCIAYAQGLQLGHRVQQMRMDQSILSSHADQVPWSAFSGQQPVLSQSTMNPYTILAHLQHIQALPVQQPAPAPYFRHNTNLFQPVHPSSTRHIIAAPHTTPDSDYRSLFKQANALKKQAIKAKRQARKNKRTQKRVQASQPKQKVTQQPPINVPATKHNSARQRSDTSLARWPACKELRDRVSQKSKTNDPTIPRRPILSLMSNTNNDANRLSTTQWVGGECNKALTSHNASTQALKAPDHTARVASPKPADNAVQRQINDHAGSTHLFRGSSVTVKQDLVSSSTSVKPSVQLHLVSNVALASSKVRHENSTHKIRRQVEPNSSEVLQQRATPQITATKSILLNEDDHINQLVAHFGRLSLK